MIVLTEHEDRVRRLLTKAAVAGTTIPYGALPGGRGHVGAYLYRIADFEAEHDRPPLTALAVRKNTSLPGEGFAIAMGRVGYAQPGETDAVVWHRALADVFTYWQSDAHQG